MVNRQKVVKDCVKAKKPYILNKKCKKCPRVRVDAGA